VALAARAINPSIRIIGISMERGAAMHESLRAGRPVPVTEYPSLADSLGGGIGLENRLTFSLCRDLLDEVVLVGEDAIRDAMQAPPTAAMVSGRNLDMGAFTEIMAGRDVLDGDMAMKGRTYGP